MHAQQARQPTEKPIPLLVAWLVDPGWLASSRRVRQGSRSPTHKADFWTRSIFQGLTLGPKIGTKFCEFSCFFFRFLGPTFGSKNCTKNWSRIRLSLGKLIARAPGGQFLGPVFGPRVGPIFGPPARFFSGNFAFLFGIMEFSVLQGPGLAAGSCCADLRDSSSLPCPRT